MKSQTNMIHRVALGILKDAKAAYPEDRREFERDERTLTRLVDNRGVGVYTNDLPYVGKGLMALFQNGFLSTGGPMLQSKGPRSRRPRLFSGLWNRIVDDSLCLRVDADPTAIFFLRSLSDLGKSLISRCTPRIEKETADEFRRIDESLPHPTLSWGHCDFDGDSAIRNVHFCNIVDDHLKPLPLLGEDHGTDDKRKAAKLLANLQFTSDEFSSKLGPYSPISFACSYSSTRNRGREWEERFRRYGLRHGPGAVSQGLSGAEKYSFPNLPKRLLRIFPNILFGKNAIFGEDERRKSLNEVPSRLIAVPKDRTKPRLIAAEPVENQWAQQLTLQYFISEIKRIGLTDFIDITDQVPSRYLAYKGSLDNTISTVDLSSASDRLSCYVVERVFRRHPWLLRALNAHRTSYIRNDIGTSWNYLKLRKFATQGTAVTFPVQTVCFFLMALSLYEGDTFEQKLAAARGTLRVFGDDITIATELYADLVSLLHHCGLLVNITKSYSSNYFRESCGGDFYRGYDVTPVKIKGICPTTATGRRAIVDTSNNLFNKGLFNASKSLSDLLPTGLQYPVDRVVPHTVWGAIIDQHRPGGNVLVQPGGSEGTTLGALPVDSYGNRRRGELYPHPTGSHDPVLRGLPDAPRLDRRRALELYSTELCDVRLGGGFTSFSGSDWSRVPYRYNEQLSRPEWRVRSLSDNSVRHEASYVADRFNEFIFMDPYNMDDYVHGVSVKPNPVERVRWVAPY